jgi:hypothetical protein
VFVVRPLLPPADAVAQSYTHHVIAHPLVLGVATPENEFAKSLGIAWDDQVGFEIARRVDPTVTYLGPGYEAALFTYYRQLWRRHPGEMLKLYILKAGATGRDLLLALDRLALPWLPRSQVMMRVNKLVNGYVFYAATLALLTAAAWLTVSRRLPLFYLAAVLAASALLMLLESTLIMPTFVAMYHAYLLVFFALLPLVALQMLIDGIGARASFLRV